MILNFILFYIISYSYTYHIEPYALGSAVAIAGSGTKGMNKLGVAVAADAHACERSLVDLRGHLLVW